MFEGSTDLVLYLADTIFISSILLMSLISARFLTSLDIWDRNFQYPLRGSFGHDSSVVVRQGTLSQIVVVCLQDVSMSLDTERCQEDRTGLLRSESSLVRESTLFQRNPSCGHIIPICPVGILQRLVDVGNKSGLEYNEWSMMLDGLIANWGTFIAALMCLGGLVEMLVDFWNSPQPWQQSPWFLDHFKVSNSCKMWLPCELWRFSLQSQNLRWVWYLWRSTTREGEFLKSGGCQAFKSSPSIFEIKMLQNWGHKLIHYKHMMHMKSRWPLVYFWCKKKTAHGSRVIDAPSVLPGRLSGEVPLGLLVSKLQCEKMILRVANIFFMKETQTKNWGNNFHCYSVWEARPNFFTSSSPWSTSIIRCPSSILHHHDELLDFHVTLLGRKTYPLKVPALLSRWFSIRRAYVRFLDKRSSVSSEWNFFTSVSSLPILPQMPGYLRWVFGSPRALWVLECVPYATGAWYSFGPGWIHSVPWSSDLAADLHDIESSSISCIWVLMSM